MATKYFCDRCENESSPTELSKISIEDGDVGFSENYDLCTACLRKLKKFLKGE